MSKKHNPSTGSNSILGNDITFGENVVIGANCVIEDGVTIGDNVFIDSNTIIRSHVSLGSGSVIGANCIIGEHQMDFYLDRKPHVHPLLIGGNAIIRSGSILYSGSSIGDNFQTGHHVTIRENSSIGSNVSIGTLSDIQGQCKLGNYVRLHSNVHIGMLSTIDDCVWIFPYVILTNDPTPPSDDEIGVHVCSFAVIATNSVLLPGVKIHHDALVGAGSIVTKDVGEYQVVFGNPARVKGDVRDIKDRVSGGQHYPWRYYFDRAMPWKNFGFDSWYHNLSDEAKLELFRD